MEQEGYIWNMVIGNRVDGKGLLIGSSEVTNEYRVQNLHRIPIVKRPVMRPLVDFPDFRFYKPYPCMYSDVCCLAWYPGILASYPNDTIIIARRSCDHYGGGTYLCQKNAFSAKPGKKRKKGKKKTGHHKSHAQKSTNPPMNETETGDQNNHVQKPTNSRENKTETDGQNNHVQKPTNSRKSEVENLVQNDVEKLTNSHENEDETGDQNSFTQKPEISDIDKLYGGQKRGKRKKAKRHKKGETAEHKPHYLLPVIEGILLLINSNTQH
ncbi:unnamed protein product [Gongylonema pulchrum]|uniref:Uncharacterized protein n=1 Tax=Gongylonema pulchrum TaxID=637853 RepID=A0A183DFZ5_9BILA|nr:unnamed protein product [Gongylonema pulchrum]